MAGDAARTLGGGTARNPEMVTGGGPRVENIEAALEQARTKAIEAWELHQPPPGQGGA